MLNRVDLVETRRIHRLHRQSRRHYCFGRHRRRSHYCHRQSGYDSPSATLNPAGTPTRRAAQPSTVFLCRGNLLPGRALGEHMGETVVTGWRQCVIQCWKLQPRLNRSRIGGLFITRVAGGEAAIGIRKPAVRDFDSGSLHIRAAKTGNASHFGHSTWR